MKKMYLLLTLLIITVVSYSQTNEDCRTKLTSTGSSITIKNKSVATKYRVEQTGKPDSVTNIVNVGCSLTLGIHQGCTTIKVTPVTTCISTCTNTFVQLKNPCSLLPVVLAYLTAQYNKINREVTVDFNIQEVTDVSSIDFEVSTDTGIKMVKVMLPADLKINTNNRITIKLDSNVQ